VIQLHRQVRLLVARVNPDEEVSVLAELGGVVGDLGFGALVDDFTVCLKCAARAEIDPDWLDA
jgi:hypothetical protein